MPRAFIAAALILLVAGCAVLPGRNLQGYAGINYAEVSFDADGKLAHVLVIGGKEQDDIKIEFRLPDGRTLTYAAKGVKAFDAQAARAGVEKALAEAGVKLAPAVIEGVIKALRTP